MWHDIRKIFDQLSEDENVRCILFSGAGDKAFCAGLDVSQHTHYDTVQKIVTNVVVGNRFSQHPLQGPFPKLIKAPMLPEGHGRFEDIASTIRTVSLLLNDVKSVN